MNTCDCRLVLAGRAHGAPATETFTAKLGSHTFEMDICDPCIAEFVTALRALGVRPSMALVDGKPRGTYTAHSGRPYTTAEARDWLVAEGHEVPVAGRISNELLELYAAAH